jgi:hypothetical protein
MIAALEPKDRREFENGLQARIRHECRGVVSACGRMRELGATFRGLLLDQASKFLERRVPHLQASAALLLHCPSPAALTEKVREYVTSSAPASLGPEPAPRPTVTLLGLPEDDASDRLAAVMRNTLPEQPFRTVTTADDVFILQEVQNVSPASLPHLSANTAAPGSADNDSLPTAHARADVAWVPVGAE